MSLRRFVADSSREAMAQIRRELGEEALIISTRTLTGGRVEVLAASADAMEALMERAHASPPQEPPSATPAAAAPASQPRLETFSDYLRRQKRVQEQAAARSVEAGPAPAAVDSPQRDGDACKAAASAPAMTEREQRAAVPVAEEPAARSGRAEGKARAFAAGDRPLDIAAGRSPAAAPARAIVADDAQAPAVADARLLEEVQAMRTLLLEQMAVMAAATAAELQRRHPAQVRAMTRLITAGFSIELAREIAAEVPADLALDRCEAWLREVLAMDLRCAPANAGIVERGGVFAFVGPTGVGKTTTVAKLAARFAAVYGAASLGLITLDAYRVGAQEQLQTYGRILGTPVHLAQDAETLAEVLAAMGRKRLVLIDTCGVSQRDQRLEPMLKMLACAGSEERPVQRVLLLNAASHAGTLDAVARAWHAGEAGMAILTKLDEAVAVGGALDVALRYRLLLLGATNGQRVPEDWLPIGSPQLAELALRPGGGPFALSDEEAALLASTPAAQPVRA